MQVASARAAARRRQDAGAALHDDAERILAAGQAEHERLLALGRYGGGGGEAWAFRALQLALAACLPGRGHA